jgi:hypothetical protein
MISYRTGFPLPFLSFQYCRWGWDFSHLGYQFLMYTNCIRAAPSARINRSFKRSERTLCARDLKCSFFFYVELYMLPHHSTQQIGMPRRRKGELERSRPIRYQRHRPESGSIRSEYIPRTHRRDISKRQFDHRGLFYAGFSERDPAQALDQRLAPAVVTV